MPRWTYGTSCSTSPVGPIVPTTASSPTVSPRRTLVEPRCVRVTEYPSAVWIVTTLPLAGTVPANETRPDAGAAGGGELRDRLRSGGHICGLSLIAGAEHERDLTLRRLGELARELAGAAARDLLVTLRQLSADSEPAVRILRGK